MSSVLPDTLFAVEFSKRPQILKTVLG